MVFVIRRPLTLQLKNVRYFKFENYYKVETERQKRVREKAENSLKDKSLFDLVKYVANEGVSEAKKYFREYSESQNYK